MSDLIKVMVAEDLDVLREHYSSIVKSQEDMELIGSVENGKKALELVERIEPNVILLDVEMEDRYDGITFAKKVMETHPQIRIVFLTVHEDDETVFSAFESGAVDYIVKNSSSINIIESIRNAYKNISVLSPEIAFKITTEFSKIRKNQKNIFENMNILSNLTPSEIEILSLLLRDKKVVEISQIRHVELSTTKSQMNQLLKKFNKKRNKEIIKLIKDLGIDKVLYQINGKNTTV